MIERFFSEVAQVEFGGPASEREVRLKQVEALRYNDLSADRNCVAIVQALEAILHEHSAGNPGCSVVVNSAAGGLVLQRPGSALHTVLYAAPV